MYLFIKLNSELFYKTFVKYGITTPLRIAHFLAQIAHESSNFTADIEGLNYSEAGLLKTFSKYFTKATAKLYARNPQAIANKVYANRLGNGNEKSGDGWKYRGRGLIQLTGRANYEAYKKYSGIDIISNPELARNINISIDIAGWYWTILKKVNQSADTDNVETVTLKINGGKNGIGDRINKTQAFKKENITLDDLKKKVRPKPFFGYRWINPTYNPYTRSINL